MEKPAETFFMTPETLLFIREHRMDDVRRLALQAHKYPDVDMPVAITQIAGRQIAAEKIPSWDATEGILYPKHLSLEQCSSEITARYKATLLQGETLADLTGGFGIDCAFLSAGFQRVTYVERQEELCEIAAHNFPLLRLNHIDIRHDDGVTYLNGMPHVDCIFLDPARRNAHGGKTVAIADCEPDVSALEECLLDKAKRVMVKLSPMLDLALALKELEHIQEIHIVSVANECKELLLILGKSAVSEVPIHCINLLPKDGLQRFVFTREQELRSECSYTDTLEEYLYEPNASLLKAGAFRSLSTAYTGIRKLHPNSHLYTSRTPIAEFPGRMFRITDHCSLNKKEIKEHLAGLKKANITVRNFPSTVAELRKRLKLTDGGDTYLFASTLNNGSKVLVRCEKSETGKTTDDSPTY